MRALIGPAKAADTAPEGAIPGSWETIAVADDAKTVLALMEAQAAGDRMLSMECWSYDDDGLIWCVRIFGFVC